MAATIAGCGKDANNTSDAGEKTTSSAEASSDGTEAAAEPIEYNVEDYVTLGEYKGLEVSVDGDYEVDDTDINEYVDNQCASYPEYEDTDKTTVEDGDFVNIDYEGLLDGTAFDGGTAEGYVLEIGSNSFIEGFEEGLVGAEVGKEVALNLTFPENYTNTEMAGKEVVFNVTVNKIVTKKDMTHDTLTDEYVSANFSKDNVTAYLDDVKTTLENNATSTKESDTRSAVIDAVTKNCEISGFPDGLLEQRVAQYISQFQTMCDSYGVDMKDYLSSYYGMTEDDFNTQVESYMTENLTTELVFQAVAKAEGIEIDEDGYGAYVKECMANYGYTDEESLYDAYGEDYLKNVYTYDKALDQVMGETTINYTNTAADAAATDDAAATEDAADTDSANE